MIRERLRVERQNFLPGRGSTEAEQKRYMRMAWRNPCWVVMVEEKGGGIGFEEDICKAELFVPGNIISKICQHGKLRWTIKFRLVSDSKRGAYSVTPLEKRCQYHHKCLFGSWQSRSMELRSRVCWEWVLESVSDNNTNTEVYWGCKSCRVSYISCGFHSRL